MKWAQHWFPEQLVGLEAEKDGKKATITKVVDCSGDVDLNQRKGKIITIYDITLKLNWEGKLLLQKKRLRAEENIVSNIDTLYIRYP